MTTTYEIYGNTPLGPLKITGNQDGISTLDFVETALPGDDDPPSCLKAGVSQIDEYFKGIRRQFQLPLNPAGTRFQKSVWRQLEKIPFGEVIAYRQLADAVGNPAACRAVGNANGKNPIAIVIPCHRVIGSNGGLTGYGGGLWRKEWLISHERGLQPSNQRI